MIKGFNFEREDIKSKNLVVRLSEDNEFIESFFLHRNPNHPTQYIIFLLGRNYYRYMNLYFNYDTQYKQWFSTKTFFFYRALAEIINLPSWNIFNFMKRYYFQEKRGNGYVIGLRDQRQRLGNRAYLMPLIWENDNTIIAINEVFYTALRHLREPNSFVNKMKYLGAYNLTNDDMNELNLLHPGFSLKQLHKCVKTSHYVDSCGRSDLIRYPDTGYQAPGMSFFQQGFFEYPTKKYKDWLKTDFTIFEKPCITKIPKLLKYCHKLFDANVLVIKELVKDIDDSTPIVHIEWKKNFFV